MDESQKREAIKRYFVPFPKWTMWVITVGVLIAVVGHSAVAVLFGGVVAALAAWRLWSWSQKATDHQMDEWVDADLAGLKARALQKCNLDPAEVLREPVVVTGPRFRNRGGAQFGMRRGGDQKVRFTPIDASVINFTENQLVLYQCALDLVTGNPLSEAVDEYFYKDVVSAATQSKSITCELNKKDVLYFPNAKKSIVNSRLQLNTAETFVLTTSGGTSVEVVLSDPALVASMGGALPTQLADQAVQAVRKMLREKKAS